MDKPTKLESEPPEAPQHSSVERSPDGNARPSRARGPRKQGAPAGRRKGTSKGLPADRARPAGPIGSILWRLLRYMRPHTALLAGVIFAALLTTAAELAPPLILRWVVDRLMLEGRTRYIAWAAGSLMLLSLVQGGIDFLRLYLTAYMGQRIVFEIRNAVFEHLSRLSFSFYDQARTGDLMSRVTADVDALDKFFGRAAVIVLTNVLTLMGIFGVLLAWNWRLALIYLICLPLIAHGMRIYAREVRPAMGRIRRALAALSVTLQESLAGVLVVKVFGREPFERSRVDRQNQRVLQANLESARITSLWMPYAHVVMGVATALVLWGAGRGVIAGQLSLGVLVGFTTYIQILLRPIRQTGMMLSMSLQALAASERIFMVLDTRPDVRDAPDAYPLPPVTGHVRFEGVSFSYDTQDGERQALYDITLEAAPGNLVALVGPSGAGKTTLAHLLPRFYDAQAGQITIDGHNIREVTVQSLRDAIGIALQTVFLFDASIGENIAYGNPQATDKEIVWAAKVTQMHDFITSLPLGYGTPVGERGVRLSGGQKQRIALARVLLTDPRILILDEPTSSVDAETERQIQRALERVWAQRTTFVIAHRLWTVQKADQILVLRDGRIIERAWSTPARSAHEALTTAGGFYAHLYAIQARSEHMTSKK